MKQVTLFRYFMKAKKAEPSSKRQRRFPVGVNTTSPPGGWSAAKYVGHGVWNVGGIPMYSKPYQDGGAIKTVWTPIDDKVDK